ncbi:hypothetical protein [Bradyrhizobium sp. URHD0069]|uniref:hypothetical protein n=1 Tax=Bradyrhizobium sp. URHD0069 TaxID=1380355 RepID=UPI000A8152AD|nr:hypothetical protein [Bradyrhizobium sp. URHD0069]
MKGWPKRKKAALAGAAFSKTLLIYLFSVVVGHGATHHRRQSDDGKWRGGWFGSGSWGEGHTAEARAMSSASEAGDGAVQVVLV